MRRGLVVLDHRTGDDFPQIARVLRVLARLDGATLRKIGSAHDHKGTLHIDWGEVPDPVDMGRVEHEWSEEHEYMLAYQFPDGRRFDVETRVTTRIPA